jgi:hypothetical protein
MNLPSNVRFVAGFVHDKRSMQEHQQILKIIEVLRPDGVDIASSCGLGRRDRATAEKMLDTTRQLAAN